MCAEFDADIAARGRSFGPDAPASALARTDARRRFDALRAIFRAAVEAPRDGVAPEPVVNLHVGLATYERLVSRHATGEAPVAAVPVDLRVERMESSNGVAVSPDDVMVASLVGAVRRVVVDSAGVVVDAGRKRRLFTGVAREMALMHWQRCGHPGCTVPAARCDVDHMQEWTDANGRTDQSNGHPRCSTHNTWKSRHRLRTTRSPDGYVVDWRSDGSPMVPVGRRVESGPIEPDRQDRSGDASAEEHVARWRRCTVRLSSDALAGSVGVRSAHGRHRHQQ